MSGSLLPHTPNERRGYEPAADQATGQVDSAVGGSLFPFTEAYFSDRCPIMVEVARDTYIGCGLKAGHDGPHVAPEWPPKQVAKP